MTLTRRVAALVRRDGKTVTINESAFIDALCVPYSEFRKQSGNKLRDGQVGIIEIEISFDKKPTKKKKGGA